MYVFILGWLETHLFGRRFGHPAPLLYDSGAGCECPMTFLLNLDVAILW